MENKIMNINNDNLTIDSREVANMMEIDHYKVLRKLEGSKDRKGYIKILTDSQMGVSDYFIKSSYKDESGKENRCYLFTKMGCEFIANKFTGEKGILFTAKYVKIFNQMEQKIKSNQLVLANKEIQELKNTVNEFKRLTEEAKQQYKPSHKAKLNYNKMIKTLTNNDEEVQVVKDWVFGLLSISKWEDTCIEDSKKIIETITTVSRLLAIKKFEQLRLF
ncbi:Rha family transcriptional regulator [Clostridium tetani]|uniref:Rha family transcriptional regulator n=1 Tax=Clostridium tetani TaxID=1513 RepID=UPI002953FAA9|nr:Rha family transcriptional regulator [Clostridium tetani]